MKKTYAISIRKSDGSMAHREVLAAADQNEPAIIVAIRAAIAACGPGEEVVNANNVNCAGAVDIDATLAS